MENFLKENHDKYLVAGQRKCVFSKFDEDFLLTVYEDNPASDNQDYILHFAINRPAAVVWDVLRKCPGVGEFEAAVIACFPRADQDLVRKELEGLLCRFYELKLIDFVSEKPGDAATAAFLENSLIKGQVLFPGPEEYVPFAVETISFPFAAYAMGLTGGDPPFQPACPACIPSSYCMSPLLPCSRV